MNALLRRTARGLADRAIEITAVTALGTATGCLTWWFAAPLSSAVGWWIATEVRLRRARRAVPASPRAELGAAGAVSPAAVSPAEPVSAGQHVDGRAGA